MAGHRDKVIITCAVTGAIHTPTMSPYLPITPDEIAEAAIGAAKAGAAIVHLHARDPEDGRPTQDPEMFMQFLPKIKAATRRGDQHHHRRRADDERRGAAAAGAAGSSPEVASLNMGSMNFGLFQLVASTRSGSTSGSRTTSRTRATKTVEAGAVVNSSIVWESRGARSLFGRNGVAGLANVDITPELAESFRAGLRHHAPQGRHRRHSV